ncbi:MAG: hypothetical protein RBS40_03255 [Rhodocyclaceae bacterium]|jgi:sulfate transport system substrate-binding protein|nr:hypothetical protein [Rhodocyclaceae bacterium]
MLFRSVTGRRLFRALALAVAALGSAGTALDVSILNVSYDVSWVLYKNINPAFAAQWNARTGERALGSWEAVNKAHFADGGRYDQIVVKY